MCEFRSHSTRASHACVALASLALTQPHLRWRTLLRVVPGLPRRASSLATLRSARCAPRPIRRSLRSLLGNSTTRKFPAFGGRASSLVAFAPRCATAADTSLA